MAFSIHRRRRLRPFSVFVLSPLGNLLDRTRKGSGRRKTSERQKTIPCFSYFWKSNDAIRLSLHLFLYKKHTYKTLYITSKIVFFCFRSLQSIGSLVASFLFRSEGFTY
jgi:hypothetical protein